MIIRVNRIEMFNEQLEKFPILHNSVLKEIPEIYFSLLRHQPKMQQVQISLHPQGVLFAATIHPKQQKELKKKILPALFPAYAPVIQEKYGIPVHYLSEPTNSFFGYFEIEGGWIGSYSRKLLEETLRQYITGKGHLGIPTVTIRNAMDANSPVNLLIKKEELGIIEKPGLSLADEVPWMGSDLLFTKNNMCLFTVFSPAFAPSYSPDSIAFILTEKISREFPSHSFSYQLEAEGDHYYYTGCISIPTENPAQDHHTQNEHAEEVAGPTPHEDLSGDSCE